METSQLEQLKNMSLAARTSHYLKKLIAKEITREQYDNILEVVLRIPYTKTVEQGSEILSDSGEQRTGMDSTVDQVHYESIGHDGGITDAVKQNTNTPSMECSSEVFVSRLADEKSVDGQGRAKEDKSQKAKLLTLLSDYEWHTTPDIQVAVYGANHLGVARIAPRVNDLKNDGYDIESERVTKSIWAYRLIEKNVMFEDKIKDIATLFAAG